jgi:creatinine amidohydrolase/Fe(II)-dependent formamide hydrolase-like protein
MKKLIVCSILSILFMHINMVNAQNINCWRWERLKPGDLERAIRTVPVAYLVVSPLEWHGDAMFFGTDPVIGTEIAEIAWRSTGGVLIPTLYIGSETEYKDWTSDGLTSYWGMEWITKEHNPGSLYLSNNTFELVMRDMIYAIEREGFKACVIVSGHGGTEYSLILKQFEERSAASPMKIIYSDLIGKERTEETEFPGSGGHADFAEASILGGADSTMVDKSIFGKSQRDQKIGLYEKNVNLINYEKGKAFINYRAELIIETVNQFLDKQN